MAEQIPVDQGRLVLIAPADPAMGDNPSITQPQRVRWKLKSFQATLITSVTVADRVPELTITVNALEVLRITASQGTAASLTFIYGWMAGERALAVTGQTSRVTALPRNYLVNNQSIIAITTVDIDPADQWQNIRLVVEEWIEPLA